MGVFTIFRSFPTFPSECYAVSYAITSFRKTVFFTRKNLKVPLSHLSLNTHPITAQKEAIFFDFRTESCILEAIRFFIFLLLSYEVY